MKEALLVLSSLLFTLLAVSIFESVGVESCDVLTYREAAVGLLIMVAIWALGFWTGMAKRYEER